jgi:acyl-CoA dehydrogenase
MLLFHPHRWQTGHNDPVSCRLVEKTVAFFENKGLKQIKEDDQAMTWYEDFLEFIKQEKVFATLLTPAGYGGGAARWDMSRIAPFNEVLAFYGLCYWYAWQVTILGLGPIWMGSNEAVKQRATQLLENGEVFAFGLSEKEHGADLYASEMMLHPQPNGSFLARGSKYYIGNGNCAALIATFGKLADSGEYVFFVVSSDHPNYECVKKIDTSGVRQAYVAEFSLHDYPISREDILSVGKPAWDSSLNSVNIGKFELGFAALGIATHCFYEALNHAAKRSLYGHFVTDFPHVRKSFSEAYARLHAAKLFSLRAGDYLRSASDADRRYLLFNPIVKMKVTSQGEKVVALLHNIIAAKGFEQDTYFEMAIRDIGMLPKLEGTEHVNMALNVKFIRHYFFGPVDYPEIPRRDDPADDAYLFRQVTGGLAQIRFPDYRLAYRGVTSPNVQIFRDQVELFRQLLSTAPPTTEQLQNIDYMLAAGELFTLIVYAQLVLENSRIYQLDETLLEQIFDFLIRDYAGFALQMILNHHNQAQQEELFRRMLKKPVQNQSASEQIWQQVSALAECYRMPE